MFYELGGSADSGLKEIMEKIGDQVGGMPTNTTDTSEQQAREVQPGDRIIIHGLKSREDLNGQSAVLVGPAPNGRINVQLDSGEQIALKQDNLGIAAPAT